MKRRIVVIVVTVVVLAVIAGGVALYVRRNTGVRLLKSAEVALRAGKSQRAADLAGRYIGQEADDWRGHQLRGRALTRLGRYEEAREALREAARLAPGSEDGPLLGLADAHSLPARIALAIGVSSSRWMARLSGRAPYTGS